MPLAPFLVLGAGAGLFTAWVERTIVGAEGPAFDLTSVERGLIAGRAAWFYLLTLVWPANLTFIYPRWQVSQAVWWQYLYPAAALAILALLWRLRRQGRGPLTAALFFLGTLFPVLGFFNVYPFLFSVVADHFQYLASLGMITLAAAGASRLLERGRSWTRPAGSALCPAVLCALAVQTWKQSHFYADAETLYRATIERNAGCWMAHNNLAGALIARGAIDDAMPLVRRALEIKPDYAEAHNNLGIVLTGRGRPDEAIAHYRRSLELRPGYAEAHNNLAVALAGQGNIDQAIAHYQRSLEADAGDASVHYRLALVSSRSDGSTMPSITFGWRWTSSPSSPRPQQPRHRPRQPRANRCGPSALPQGRSLRPAYAEAHNNLGIVLSRGGHADEAISHFRKALQLRPEDTEVRTNLFTALASRRRVGDSPLQWTPPR